jgi:hypothetical protein
MCHVCTPRHHFVDTSADASRPGSGIVEPAIAALRLLSLRGSLWRLPPPGCLRHCDVSATVGFTPHLCQGMHDALGRVSVTDTLTSSGAATRELLPGVAHRPHRSLNHRAEHAHQPTCQRARRMQRLQSSGQAPRCLSACGPMAQHCRPRRHR